MAEYRTKAQPPKNMPSTKEIIVEVTILRDNVALSMFAARFSEAINDAAILIEIERRVQEFVKVDSDAIAKGALTERAAAIAASLEDRIW